MKQNFSEILKMNREELLETLRQARERALELRFKVSARELKAWQEIKSNKQKIARVLTALKAVTSGKQ